MMQGWNNPFYYGNINKKIWLFRHVYLLFINKICPSSIYNRREGGFGAQTKSGPFCKDAIQCILNPNSNEKHILKKDHSDICKELS